MKDQERKPMEVNEEHYTPEDEACADKVYRRVFGDRDPESMGSVELAIREKTAMALAFLDGAREGIRQGVNQARQEAAEKRAQEAAMAAERRAAGEDDYSDIVVISGASGSGKDTIIAMVREKDPGVGLSVSCTTRRIGVHNDGTPEAEGVDYYFLNEKEDFMRLVDEGGFVEWAEVHGELYGTPRSEIVANREQGRDITILNVDTQGALAIKAQHSAVTTIFILPPCADALKKRLVERGRESMEKILKRMQDAPAQIEKAYEYDYVVMNDDREVAAGEVRQILQAVRKRTAFRKRMIETVLQSFGREE